MKRLLVFVFVIVFNVGFSQSTGEMNSADQRIIYDCDFISLRKAKQLSKEKSPEAHKHFRNAQIKMIFEVLSVTSFVVNGIIGNTNIQDDLTREIGLVTVMCGSALHRGSVSSIRKGVYAFNNPEKP